MTSLESESPPSLPGKFKNIQGIRSTKPGSLASLIGFAKDFQPAIATSREDWKSSLELVDPSTQYEEIQGSCIKLHYFAPPDHQLENIGPSDLVVLRDAKVQDIHNVISLLTTWNTQVHVLKASAIPHDLSSYIQRNRQRTLPWISKGPKKVSYNLVNLAEMKYALWASKLTSQLNLPSHIEFEEKVVQAMNLRDKFSLLKDVKPNGYYNVTGQVIKLFSTPHGWVEIQLSDYTANRNFYEHLPTDESSKAEDPQDESRKDWPGPYGKFTIQVTLFDGNASYAMESIHEKDWVHLKNVRIVETDTGMLQGKLHGKGGDEHKVLIGVLDPVRNSTDGRLKDAVMRKRNYWDTFDEKWARQLKRGAGEDGKFEDDGRRKRNGKQRRKEARAVGIKKGDEKDLKANRALELNVNVKCSFPLQPTSSLAEIMRPEKIISGEGGEDVFSPFTLRKYRAHVRVVDFFPHRIEDFAVSRQVSEYDILSDYSGADESEDQDEDDRHIARRSRGDTSIEWEWRFALQVEDVGAKDEGSRLWLLVDNPAAQGLLGLEDNATNLRKNPDLVYQVKEKLFILWGDLHDTIAATLPPDPDGPPPSTLESWSHTSSPVRRAGDQPDADDSDNERKASIHPPARGPDDQAHAKVLAGTSKTTAKNKPFTCCIQQYGIKTREDNHAQANAGEGQKWQRVFGLFGTNIV